MLKTLVFRFIRLMAGLLMFGAGCYLIIQANIGLSPWEAFGMGLSRTTGLSYGLVTIMISMAVLVIDVALKEKVGFGTLLNAVFVGVFVDMFMSMNLVPMMQSFLPGVAMLLSGQVAISLATYLYVGAAAGSGPRDSLMVALGKRIGKVPIGAVRGGMEGCVLVIGWLLGAKVGIGTVISVFGIGFIIQMTFKLLKFDVKAVVHESCIDTIKNLRGNRGGLAGGAEPDGCEAFACNLESEQALSGRAEQAGEK